MRRGLMPLLLVVALLGACSGSGNELHEVSADQYADWAEATGKAPQWPLTVDPVQIDCLGRGAVGLVADGTSYWLNGLAKDRAEELDLADLDAIWADDPATGKVMMGGFTAYALSVCD